MAKFQIFVDVRAYFFVSDVDGSMSKQFSAEKIKQPALKRLQQIFQGHHQYNRLLSIAFNCLNFYSFGNPFLSTMIEGIWPFVSPIDSLRVLQMDLSINAKCNMDQGEILHGPCC